MPISRRTVIASLGLGATASLLPRRAFAAYPDRPIHLIVPFAPGGNADIVGRIVGERMSDALGQPVVVDNRGGAGGSIGAEAVARPTATCFWSARTARLPSTPSCRPSSATIR